MKIETIIETAYKLKGLIKNQIVYNIMKLKNPRLVALLKKNAEFKNIHKGKRCFILGNGPSLKKEKLELLQNEIVFTVNQVNRLPNFNILKPTYHVWVDKSFFNIDESKEEDMELLSFMTRINSSNPDLICFYPIEQYDFCVQHKIDNTDNIRYFAHSSIFHENYREKIDLCRYLPGFGTVVQNCITMAIYMGFSEIYLLGCDNTGLMVTLKTALKNNDDQDYAYEVTENEKKRLEKMVKSSSIEAYAESYARTLRDYRILYNCCRDKGIKLINCSSTTVIDSIPRMKLEDIKSKE